MTVAILNCDAVGAGERMTKCDQCSSFRPAVGEDNIAEDVAACVEN